ncbi:DNA topology modulation protein [Virgibacillus salarius]|uniref:DNA topology modulation protein n=1 Tax=Virgibacillus salarius TaxID=447199 RepID=UPI0004135862|nr:DNA topology modulation protein [Priestia megaterium]
MQKVMIIGNGGSGKSTLAKQLGAMLEIPVYHMDALFWKPGWTPIDRDTLIRETKKIMGQDKWIIDGNYNATMEIRMQQADTIIFLHYRTIHCLYGIVKRRIQYRNRTRSDMGKGCPEKLDWEFFNWVRTFNKKKAPTIYHKLSKYQDKHILIFKRRKDLNHFVHTLL